MWEVDPETRRKLQEFQKRPGNAVCCDCGAPAPQWASPKFGIFLCLTCAGIHRGLGVHISFVRSITMDQFKTNEIARMDNGGNNALKEYFASQPDYNDSMSVADRYSAPFAEDYKEKLTALCEGREWTGPAPRNPKTASVKRAATGVTPRSGSPASFGGSPTSGGGGGGAGGQKEKNEAYFARMGAENANRRDDLPPNQGGKYTGFGSAPAEEPNNGGGAGIGGWDDVTKDPVAALSKGWGFFSSVVQKSAKHVNDGFIQPAAQKLADSNIPQNLTRTATTLGASAASTARGAADNFNRYIDQQNRGQYAPVEPERKDFWDSFGAAPGGSNKSGGIGSRGSFDRDHEEWEWDEKSSLTAGQSPPKNSAIGTSGIKKTATSSSSTGRKSEDNWENDKW